MSATYGTLSHIKLPTSLSELKDYIKRRLGYPVVQINVTDEQIYDRIADTLLFYRDYHYNGSNRTYVKWQLTSTDISNQYLAVSGNIIGVTRILNPNLATVSGSMFTSVEFWMRSQINFGDFFGSTQSSFIEYFLTQQRISDMDQLFKSYPGTRFNVKEGKLYIDFDWANDVKEGDWIIGECFSYLDPETYKNIFYERFILEHATAGVKMQWGANIKKFGGIQLPGGMTMDGQGIYDEGKNDRDSLEEGLLGSGMPPLDLIG